MEPVSFGFQAYIGDVYKLRRWALQWLLYSLFIKYMLYSTDKVHL